MRALLLSPRLAVLQGVQGGGVGGSGEGWGPMGRAGCGCEATGATAGLQAEGRQRSVLLSDGKGLDGAEPGAASSSGAQGLRARGQGNTGLD